MEKQFFVHESSYVDDNVTIGKGTKIWHFCHVQKGAVLGENCSLGQNVNVANNVKIGSGVRIQNNVSVYEGVEIEDNVFCGPSCVFTNVINPRSFISRKDEFKATHVGKGATIGANATIVCGNNIGNYALVGAGAVVTRPVPPFALVTGNPARQTGWVSKYGHKLDFDYNGRACCPESGEWYRFSDGVVISEG